MIIINAFVIGCGRWGTFIGWYLDQLGHNVSIYGRENSVNLKELMTARKNKYLTLSDSIMLTTDLSGIDSCDAVFISVNSQGLRKLCDELNKYDMDNKYVVLCMKGIEADTCKRLSEVAAECIKSNIKICVWLGPGHVQDYVRGIPNCMVIDSLDEDARNFMVNELSGGIIRFYYGIDLIGNEIGAAAKNVIGIAAGMLDGLNMSSLKGPLMTRATRELYRLIDRCGGNPISAYGLCHLGDYEATIFSEYSNNRRYGENIILKKENFALAEGVETAKAMYRMSKERDVDMPICTAVYSVLYENANPSDTLMNLFNRPIKQEY